MSKKETLHDLPSRSERRQEDGGRAIKVFHSKQDRSFCGKYRDTCGDRRTSNVGFASSELPPIILFACYHAMTRHVHRRHSCSKIPPQIRIRAAASLPASDRHRAPLQKPLPAPPAEAPPQQHLGQFRLVPPPPRGRTSRAAAAPRPPPPPPRLPPLSTSPRALRRRRRLLRHTS